MSLSDDLNDIYKKFGNSDKDPFKNIISDFLSKFNNDENEFFESVEKNMLAKFYNELLEENIPKGQINQPKHPLDILFGNIFGTTGLSFGSVPMAYEAPPTKAVDLRKPPPSEKFKNLPATYLSSEYLANLNMIKNMYHGEETQKPDI